jgi:hypothetical protein
MLPGTRISTGALSFSTEVDANAVSLNGILVNPDGAICGYDGAPECFVGGFGLTNTGLLCIESDGTIAGYNQGLPFTSDGRLVIQADAEPSTSDAWIARTRVGANGVFVDGWGPPSEGLILYTLNVAADGIFLDRVGASTRTLQPLQYIQSAGGLELTHASITADGHTIVNVPAGPTATIAAPQAGKIVVGAGTLWSWIITFPDMTVSSYEFATALTATTGVCFDTSGYGRHLLFTVADTSVVCVSGREIGSDFLNLTGYEVSDGATMYLSATSFGLIPDDAIIPNLSSGPGCCAYVVGG